MKHTFTTSLKFNNVRRRNRPIRQIQLHYTCTNSRITKNSFKPIDISHLPYPTLPYLFHSLLPRRLVCEWSLIFLLRWSLISLLRWSLIFLVRWSLIFLRRSLRFVPLACIVEHAQRRGLRVNFDLCSLNFTLTNYLLEGASNKSNPSPKYGGAPTVFIGLQTTNHNLKKL